MLTVVLRVGYKENQDLVLLILFTSTWTALILTSYMSVSASPLHFNVLATEMNCPCKTTENTVLKGSVLVTHKME